MKDGLNVISSVASYKLTVNLIKQSKNKEFITTGLIQFPHIKMEFGLSVAHNSDLLIYLCVIFWSHSIL